LDSCNAPVVQPHKQHILPRRTGTRIFGRKKSPLSLFRLAFAAQFLCLSPPFSLKTKSLSLNNHCIHTYTHTSSWPVRNTNLGPYLFFCAYGPSRIYYISFKMHFPTVLTALLFTTATLASPYAWAEPQSSVPSSTAVGRRPNRTHRHEKTPTFKEPCKCAQPIVPMNLLDENEKCMMKYAAQMGCYMSSKGGCPSPQPAVSFSFLFLLVCFMENWGE
jgi:hypothetical protein